MSAQVPPTIARVWPASGGTNGTYVNIQGLRGVAAVMVMFIHLLSTRDGMGADWLKYHYWWLGPAGVDIFFVISGCIVTVAAVRAADHRAALAFGVRRLLRIYPLYWCVLAAAVPASAVLVLAPAWLPRNSVWELVSLMTSNNTKVLAAWTLCYEVMFYAVLTTLVALAPRRLFAALAAWVGLECVLVVLARTLMPAWKDWPFASPLVLEFALGIGVALVIQRGVRGTGIGALALGLLGFAVGVALNARYGGWDHAWRFFCFGIPSALIVYGLIAIERGCGWTLPGWLLRTGDASYSLYLWHQLVFAALAWLTLRVHGYESVPAHLLLVIWFAIALGVGFASFRWIEAPILRLSHGLFRQRPAEQGAPA
ncbi:MAG: acyltransferase [Proteobacteria bacterium]|nr:acyltransferase [Pseudomonadota bacterium]